MSPRDGFMTFWLMGLIWANHALARYGEAVSVAQRAIRIGPNNPSFRRQLASAYALHGRLDDAREALAEYLRLVPDHTIADARKIPCKNPEHMERSLDGLRKAGLPG